MKILNVLFPLLLATAVAAQTDITGTWVRPPADGEYFEYEGLTFTEDGYYYAETVYPEDYYDIVIPEFALGLYELNGSTLTLYNMKSGEQQQLRFSGYDGQQFHLTDTGSGKSWAFTYRGSPELNDNIRTKLLSWENHRKLGGTWRSAESTLKVIPDLSIIMIRNNQDPGFFMWGHYSFTGNEMTLTEISETEATFYQGSLSNFSASGFTIANADGQEYYAYQGPLQLDEQEMMMVQQYMKMNQRLSMSTIDGMDGVRDFIWKRVEER